LGIAVFIPLFLYRNNKFVYFHARQGLVLWMISVAAVASLFLPGSGKFLFVVLMGIYAVSAMIGIVAALSGSVWELPVIGSLARRYF
jgi:fumarate reductase subunit D